MIEQLILNNDSKICPICGRNKKSEWKCLFCRRKREKLFRHDPKNWATLIIKDARFRSKKKNLPFDITPAHLELLWEKQNGLCIYTGLPMQKTVEDRSKNSKTTGNPLKVSIDRIDSRLGYLANNTVLCTDWANRTKNQYTMKFTTNMISSFTSNCNYQLIDSIQNHSI